MADGPCEKIFLCPMKISSGVTCAHYSSSFPWDSSFSISFVATLYKVKGGRVWWPVLAYGTAAFPWSWPRSSLPKFARYC